MGRVIDILFDSAGGRISGLVVPGEKRFFKKYDDIFIPLEKIRRIGDDVILVRMDFTEGFSNQNTTNVKQRKNIKFYGNGQPGENASYIRYKRFDDKKSK